jgi:hypothetical protein
LLRFVLFYCPIYSGISLTIKNILNDTERSLGKHSLFSIDGKRKPKTVVYDLDVEEKYPSLRFPFSNNANLRL